MEWARVRARLGASGKPLVAGMSRAGGELGGRPGAAYVTSTSSPLLTGTPQQSTPRCGPPAQPCWPVCRGPRTPPANTWPARPRAWSCASVSDVPSPQPQPPPLPLPAPGPGAGILRNTPSSPCLGPRQGSSQAGKAVPIPVCPLTASLLRLLCALPGLWEAGVPP